MTNETRKECAVELAKSYEKIDNLLVMVSACNDNATLYNALEEALLAIGRAMTSAIASADKKEGK